MYVFDLFKTYQLLLYSNLLLTCFVVTYYTKFSLHDDNMHCLLKISTTI